MQFAYHFAENKSHVITLLTIHGPHIKLTTRTTEYANNQLARYTMATQNMNTYAIVIAQLETKLRRQEGALAATKLHIEALKQLQTSEAKPTK